MLEASGHQVTRVRPARTASSMPPKSPPRSISDTALVTIIHAQNEIGTFQPVAEIARGCTTTRRASSCRRGAVGRQDRRQRRARSASICSRSPATSSMRRKASARCTSGAASTLPPLLLGAGQEHGRRPGTENVAYIVALGEACRIADAASAEWDARTMRRSPTNSTLRLKREMPGISLVGSIATQRLPNTLNVLFPGVSGRRLLEDCPGVLASNGSACHADSEEPSAILTALGILAGQALGVGAAVARPRHHARRYRGSPHRSSLPPGSPCGTSTQRRALSAVAASQQH